MSGPNDSPAVLVVSYRRADLLEVCLDSVRRFLPDSPVLVWDNDSSGTPAVHELAGRTPWVRWTFSTVNVGFGAAVNGLVAQLPAVEAGAVTAPLLLLNPDAVLTGDLARTRAALAGDVAVASPMVDEPGSAGQPWDVAHRHQSVVRSVVSHLGYAPRLRGTRVSDLYAAPPTAVDGYLTGCCLLVDRHAWKSLGGFDETYFVYSEEADLQRRAVAAGWSLRLVDEHHVTHTGQGTVSDDPAAARRSTDLLRNHHALMLGVHGNTGPGTVYLAATALLERAQRSTRRTRAAAPRPPGDLPQVVLTTNELVRGGAERQRVQLAGELAERGHPVTLVCLQGLGPLQAEIDPRVRVVLSPWWQPWPQGLDTNERPTVVVTDITNTEVGFALALTGTRTRGGRRPRWLVASHSPPNPTGPTYPARLAAAARRADGLIALSPAHLAELTRFQDLASPHFVAPNGVPDRSYPPRRPPGRTLRLGMLSRIVEHKNPHKLVEALLPLLDLDWTLDIFGDGPDRARLELLTPAALEGRVRWRGWSPGPDDAFPQIDVLCVPSEKEAFPLVIVEAMAAGVPVVAAGVCAVPDMLDHGRAGVVVELGSGPAWTTALRAVINDPASLGPLADRAIHRQREQLTVHAMADAYEKAFAAALRD